MRVFPSVIDGRVYRGVPVCSRMIGIVIPAEGESGPSDIALENGKSHRGEGETHTFIFFALTCCSFPASVREVKCVLPASLTVLSASINVVVLI